jgi:hypothetical protein
MKQSRGFIWGGVIVGVLTVLVVGAMLGDWLISPRPGERWLVRGLFAAGTLFFVALTCVFFVSGLDNPPSGVTFAGILARVAVALPFALVVTVLFAGGLSAFVGTVSWWVRLLISWLS